MAAKLASGSRLGIELAAIATAAAESAAVLAAARDLTTDTAAVLAAESAAVLAAARDLTTDTAAVLAAESAAVLAALALAIGVAIVTVAPAALVLLPRRGHLLADLLPALVARLVQLLNLRLLIRCEFELCLNGRVLGQVHQPAAEAAETTPATRTARTAAEAAAAASPSALRLGLRIEGQRQ